MEYKNKYERLVENIRQYPSAAVAFSGGVDSTLLCKAAADALGKDAMAFTIFSPFIPLRERELSKKMAREIGIDHTIIEVADMDSHVLSNPVDRCYHCKKAVFGRISEDARTAGMEYLFDGSNVDDLKDYRPGMKALEEMDVRSPLRDSGLTKDDIRGISKLLGLETWSIPAYACLASRIPYGTVITDENLRMVEAGEDVLHRLGMEQVRLRHHGDIARIEAGPDEMEKLLKEEVRLEVSKELKGIGYIYVCMELEGYRMGSLNVFKEEGSNE